MRRLYADISPGLGWNGREPEALEAATATQATARTVSSFVASGVSALAAAPRPLAFLVGGTAAHAPATATITGTDADDAALTEVVTLRTTAAGVRAAGATSGEEAFKTVTSVVYSAGSGTAGTVAIGFGLLPGTRDVRGRLAFEFLLEALGDRSRPGMLDARMVNTHCLDVAGMVDGKLGTPNGNYDVPFALAYLGDIGRLSLDLWVAEAGKSHPNAIVVDHVQLRKDAERELDMIRKAMAGVGTKPPDPAANVGGAVGAIGAEALYVPPQSFTSNLGDFA